MNVTDWIMAAAAGTTVLGVIYGVWIRPRVVRQQRVWNLIQTSDRGHRERAEQALSARGLPTAVAEVSWWNASRRTARDIEVNVTVPGVVKMIEMTPPERDHVVAPWRLENDPTLEGTENRNEVRLTQDRIRPGGRCRLVVGYIRTGPHDHTATIRAYYGDREIRHAAPRISASDWLAVGLVALVLVATGFFVGAAAGAEAPDTYTPWAAQVGAIMVIGVMGFLTGAITRPQRLIE